MIEVKMGENWRPMSISQAKRMMEAYLLQEDEEYAESHLKGATLAELKEMRGEDE